MTLYEQPIFDMYIQHGLGKSKACQLCRKADTNLSRPVSIWHVGASYEQSPHKILFVGKAARGSVQRAPCYMNTVADATAVGEDLYNNSGWAFWSYTRAIAEELYGEETSWEHIALTNFVKCNSSETVDTATQTAKANCAAYLRQEIALLRPKHIVFYTNAGYDEAIETLFDRIEDSRWYDVPCGQKQIHLWIFTGVLGESRIRVLRTGHPERMNKADFTGQIIRFVQGGDNSGEIKDACTHKIAEQ